MSRTPDVETTARMFDAYRGLKSLAKVAREFGVTRQSVYDRFSRQGLALRKRPAPLPFIEFNGGKYAPNKDNYFRKTSGGGTRALLHWDMWEKSFGPIPRGHVVCFIDGDRMNLKIDNLACVRKGEDRRFGRFMALRLKSCLYCGELMARRMGWNNHEGPAAYARRKTCNPQCSGEWKKGKARGTKMRQP